MIPLLVGFLIVLAGFPIGYLLARLTKEELKPGQKWFKLLIILSAFIVILGLIIQNDPLFFTGLFFMAVISQSLNKKKR